MKYRKGQETVAQPLTYAYNTRPSRQKKQAPFSLDLNRHPPRPTLLHFESFLSTEGYINTSLQVLRSRLRARIRASQTKTFASMASAQQRYKQNYDRQVQELQVLVRQLHIYGLVTFRRYVRRGCSQNRTKHVQKIDFWIPRSIRVNVVCLY